MAISRLLNKQYIPLFYITKFILMYDVLSANVRVITINSRMKRLE